MKTPQVLSPSNTNMFERELLVLLSQTDFFFFLATSLQSSTFAQTKLNCLVSISNTSSKNRGQVFLRRCERLTGFSWIVDDAVTVGIYFFFFFFSPQSI